MALVAKVDPNEDIAPTRRARVHARAYGDIVVQVGDRGFVWTSEKSGGVGLRARGRVLRQTTAKLPDKTGGNARSQLVLDLELDDCVPNRALSILQIGQIGPYRDRAGPAAYSELARVLYKQAHTKILVISAETEAFLGTYFEGN